MALVNLSCRHCGAAVAVDESPGGEVRCPHCQEPIVVPELPSEGQEQENPLAFASLDGASPETASPQAGFDDTPEVMGVRPVAKVKDRNKTLLLLLVVLAPYALFATFAALYFYYKTLNAPHPLEMLPDYPGDNSGATRRKAAGKYERVKPETSLPPRLHVALGKVIRVGDLEVVPEKVERRKITFRVRTPGVRPEPSQAEALVLTLRCRNISRDDYFTPTDAAFTRRWRESDPEDARPYTFVDIGGKRFYGGPLPWRPRGGKEKTREYLEGQDEDDKVLAPGRERTTVVATDPDNAEVLRVFHNYRGPITWRVQLRRGLAPAGEKEVPAAAVIGVQFQAAQVRTAG